MLCVPTLSVLVTHVVVPAASACAPQPVTELAPSLKLTVPVGVPAPGKLAVTVAVNVTLWPNTDGFADDVSAVLVLAWFTVCVSVALVLVAKLVSPLYTAVMLWLPTLRLDVTHVVDPAASACAPQPVTELAPS